jgi:hypothetical protein
MLLDRLQNFLEFFIMMAPHKHDAHPFSGWATPKTEVIDVPFKIVSQPPESEYPVTVELILPHSVSPEQTGESASPFGGARIEEDAYHAIDVVDGVKLRYVEDPKRAGKVRVYIETPIDWKGRSSSAPTTHLWPANYDGGTHPPYLCIKAEHAPSTYEAAKVQAEKWVRGTKNYIATGEDITTAINRGKSL